MLGVWLTPSHRTSMPFLYSLRLIVMGLEWRRRVSEVKHTGRTQATGTFPSVTSSASALMSVTASTGIVSNCHGLCSHRAPTGIVSNCHGPCSDAHHWRRFKLPWFMQWRTPLPSFQTVMVHAVTRTTDRMLWPHKALSEHGFDWGGLVYVKFFFRFTFR